MDENICEITDVKHWYAMRVTFKRELNVKQMLDMEHIENFVPMRKEIRLLHGRRTQVMAPVIHNLIFVRAEKRVIQTFKAKVPYLQYMTTREGSKNVPIVVPDWQMDNFISVSHSDDSNLMYFDSNEVNLAAGSAVCIHGGPFDGLRGTFVKVKGKRSKKVVIAVQNVLAVAIDTFNCDFMEIIK